MVETIKHPPLQAANSSVFNQLQRSTCCGKDRTNRQLFYSRQTFQKYALWVCVLFFSAFVQILKMVRLSKSHFIIDTGQYAMTNDGGSRSGKNGTVINKGTLIHFYVLPEWSTLFSFIQQHFEMLSIRSAGLLFNFIVVFVPFFLCCSCCCSFSCCLIPNLPEGQTWPQLNPFSQPFSKKLCVNEFRDWKLMCCNYPAIVNN